MIKGKATGADGVEILIFGIAEENIERLRQGDPIYVEGAKWGVSQNIMIFYGPTLKDCLKQLREGITPDTKIHVGRTHE